jgi:uncharacterized protein (DUF1684 family)
MLPADYLELHDFRTRVFALYRQRNEAYRRGDDPAEVLQRFRAGRDALFASHPQSALDAEQRAGFQGLEHFPYNPAACVEAEVDKDVAPDSLQVQDGPERTMTMTRVARLHFSLLGQKAALSLFWIDVYGGGLFLPFRDTGAPEATYGGGRYLVDTVKGSDFLSAPTGGDTTSLILDFNYAYNPSCAYHYRWVCPLAPPENRLHMEIPAGERVFSAARNTA